MCRKAAEYLWKMTGHSSKSEQPSGYTGCGFSSSATSWGDTWGFSKPSANLDSTCSEKQDVDNTLTGYISGEADEELPDVEDLFIEKTVRRYDGSGALIETKSGEEQDSIFTIDPLVGSSSIEDVRSSGNMGKMMQNMGIE